MSIPRNTATGAAKARPSQILGLLALGASLWLSSCTVLAHSPHLAKSTTIPVLQKGHGLVVAPSGEIPYQRWRIPPWSDAFQYVWLVGNHDFRKTREVDLILYFHGMTAKDYHAEFQKDLRELATKQGSRPFIFVGFVDNPHLQMEERDKLRWKSLTAEDGERPEILCRVVNDLFASLRHRFPNIKKDNTKIVLAGFSGGGRVLTSVGKWLAQAPADDRQARVFRSRLRKMVYFDCWFDVEDLKSVPALLAANPDIKVVGTVHMTKPKKVALELASKLNLRKHTRRNALVGVGGRFVIYGEKSHWEAIKSRLKQALDT